MEERDREHADLSALSGEIRAEALRRIHSERPQSERPQSELSAGTRPRKWLFVIGGTNAALLVLAVIIVLVTRSVYDVRAAAASDAESRFITTEWHILQELQQRAARVLSEKDREIQLLRQAQESMRGRDATDGEYEQIRLRLQQAYAEREAVLQARLSAPRDELETIVSDIEQASRPTNDDNNDAVPGEPGGIDVESMSAGDARPLGWYRRVIDDLRMGRTRSALELLEVSGSDASTLLAADYDRLYSLVLLVQRQQAFLAAIDSLEEQLAERDRQLEETQQELLAAAAGLEKVSSEVNEEIEESQEIQGAAEASDETEQLVERQQDELRTLRARYAAAVEELEAARSEIELLLQASEWDLSSEQAGFTDGTYGAVETLLDYLSGVELEDIAQTRRYLLNQARASERFRELVIRARRLAAEGVDPARDDLPTARLVGVVTEATDGRVVAEALADFDLAADSRIEFRSRGDVQPGSLLGLGRVDAEVGETIVLSVTVYLHDISVGDFVYASPPTGR